MPSVCVFIRSDHYPPIADAISRLEASDIRVIVSRYGAEPERCEHYFEGGKWAGIFDYFSSRTELLEQFDRFWFPDDDIDTTPENAAKFLELVKTHRPELAQPALTPNSYYADAITLENPNFLLRWTNFVELMLPLMSNRLFARLLPLFQDRHTGQGLDFFWHQLTDVPTATAIIDATPMSHLRPRHVHLKKNMDQLALDFHSERERTFREFSIKRQRPVNLSGLSGNGKTIRRGSGLIARYLDGVLKIRHLTTNQPLELSVIARLINDQIMSRPKRPAFDPAALRTLYEKFERPGYPRCYLEQTK